ncbi:hypothetical protein KUG85_03890 [Nitratireductor sp. L1-7-SE]|uniref:Acyl carrier protein n=1 Tax=Nitratireductor rhodophyticola TaxID=2854036 RepID=A0ABS7R363_9HYPH|nr:hypothetical protein [Nitratireductor rhodophyticola]MBY8915099.1 hypothetical protein [Nitratireductor rhodophyticola]MBY8919831.1 hypothetical protein [Nitratireductor rhodophyticola]
MSVNSEICDKLHKILFYEFGVSEEDVSVESILIGGILDDGYEVFELVLSVEKEYEIGIADSLITEKTTFGDLVKIVENEL